MLRQIARPVPSPIEERGTCRHHWIIEPPAGPVSLGACRLCEEVREFQNHIEAPPLKETGPSINASSRFAATTGSLSLLPVPSAWVPAGYVKKCGSSRTTLKRHR